MNAQVVFILVHLTTIVLLQNWLNVQLMQICVVIQEHHGIQSLLQTHVTVNLTLCVWEQQVFHCVVVQDFNLTQKTIGVIWNLKSTVEYV